VNRLPIQLIAKIVDKRNTKNGFKEIEIIIENNRKHL